MRTGKFWAGLGPWRWRFDYSPPDPFAPDNRAWSLVIGPFELRWRSTLDRLVKDDLKACDALLAGHARAFDQRALDDVVTNFRRAGLEP